MAESKEKIKDFFDGYSKLMQQNMSENNKPSLEQYEMFKLQEQQQINEIEKFKQNSTAPQPAPQPEPQPDTQHDPHPVPQP